MITVESQDVLKAYIHREVVAYDKLKLCHSIIGLVVPTNPAHDEARLDRLQRHCWIVIKLFDDTIDIVQYGEHAR